MDWATLSSQAENGDTKQRLAILPKLQQYTEDNSLGRDEVSSLLGLLELLLKDHNAKVCQGILQVLHTALIKDAAPFKHHINNFVPPTVERLGDQKQTVREAARNVLLTLFEVLPTEALLAKMSGAWSHKSHRLREEISNLLMVVCQNLGISTFSASDEQKLVGNAVKLLEDPTGSVREAALALLGELYYQSGDHILDLLRRFNIRAPQQREIEACFAEIDPVQHTVHRANGATEQAQPKAAQENNAKSSQAVSKLQKLAASKRGGFGDSGGLTADGDLPRAEPVHIGSDQECKSVLAKLSKDLDLKNDWNDRIKAMLHLEGIVVGGATELPCFLEELKACKDGITEQLNDRRSAVSRVACHLLEELAVLLKGKFEPLAVHFFPYLMKVSVISVQVMADSACEAMATILTHTRAKGLAQQLLNTILTDRSKLLRTNCSKLLLLILEVWERKSFERHLDLIENVITAAAQDAQVDVRTYGRQCYGAYAAACPERIPNFLRKLSPQLREKLLQAGAEYVRQQPERDSATVQSQSIPPPKTPLGPAQRSGVKQPLSTKAKQNAGDLQQERPSSAKPGYSRVPAAGNRPPSAGPPRTASKHSDLGAKRVLSALESRSAPREHVEEDDDAVSCNGSMFSVQSNMHSSSVSSILNRIKSAKSATDWEKKREAFNDLKEWALENSQHASHVLPRLMDRIVPMIIDSMKDPHHQVVIATLEAWGAMMKPSARAQEPYLERLLSCAFLRAVDGKGVIRSASSAALRSAARAFSADVLLTALNKCLGNSKTAKGRQAILEYAIESTGSGAPAGCPPSGHPSLSMWLEGVSGLLSDKSPDVRQCASSTLEHFYRHVDSRTFLAFVSVCPVSEQSAIKRVLAKKVSGLESELVAFQREESFSFVGSSPAAGADRARAVRQIVRGCRSSSGAQSPASSCRSEAEGAVRSPGSAPVSPGGYALHAHAPEPLPGILPDEGRPNGQAYVHAGAHTHPGGREAGHTNQQGIRCQELGDISNQASREAPLRPAADPKQLKRTSPVAFTPPPQLPTAEAYLSRLYAGTPSTPGSEAAPMDAAVASARLTQIISQMSLETGSPAIDACMSIQQISRYAPESAWSGTFPQVMFTIFSWLEKETTDELIRGHLLETVREMAVNQSTMFNSYLDMAFSKLVACYRLSRENTIIVEETLQELIRRSDTRRCLEVLTLCLDSTHQFSSCDAPAEGMRKADPVTSGAIKSAALAVSQLSASQLRPALQPLLQRLHSCLQRIESDVRKAAVLCIVELYLVLGDELMPQLSFLSASQLKLVNLYVAQVTAEGSPRHGGKGLSREQTQQRFPPLQRTTLLHVADTQGGEHHLYRHCSPRTQPEATEQNGK
eukprot:CAMPEP_0177597036 /NCGR_PEP_ID=MMETSP0419_2-20121207/11476_1 /TAXON_ID=582737 /ORGANISM="Tetraselmis sp., Strain GSL018" /LENGTH=1360 /DNA_ID=CAMNT_0019089137 /DNA_START=390 /DNA_END=4473 /DNA_ORIENTATION=-